MMSAKSCINPDVILEDDGKTYSRITFTNEEVLVVPSKIKSCGDCGVSKNGIHHLGCDMEECPRCNGQFISCDCNF